MNVSFEKKLFIVLKIFFVFVVLFNSELGQLSGVAAILRFPLPQLDDDSSEDSDDPG